MEEVLEKKQCTGCMACKNICPKKAITVEIGKDGFEYTKIDKQYCINCGLCKKVCPVINKLQENRNEIQVYCCKNKDKNIRLQSSSGGIFTLIAEWILNQDGVVFGVKFNENMEAIHDYIETKDKLELFRGSKYLQSRIEDNYEKVKMFLLEKRKVLFTGTPCQIEGLLAYLGKEYNNLYTQDIICHGVPSPKVWRKYLEYIQNKNRDNLEKINFRKKDILGWKDYQVYYKYNNTDQYIHHKDDIYMRMFLKNLILRESCYNCNFKKIKRASDITIADFWGIDKINLDFYDEKGISAIMINSLKGKEIFEDIKLNMEFSKADINDIIKYNSCICKSTNYNIEREEFFKDLEEKDFEYIISKFLDNTTK